MRSKFGRNLKNVMVVVVIWGARKDGGRVFLLMQITYMPQLLYYFKKNRYFGPKEKVHLANLDPTKV
jgi:hypothetical protein